MLSGTVFAVAKAADDMVSSPRILARCRARTLPRIRATKAPAAITIVGFRKACGAYVGRPLLAQSVPASRLVVAAKVS